MSSANFVWPVHFARASTFRKGLPTTFKGLALFSLLLINQISHKKAQKAQKGFQLTIKIQDMDACFLLMCLVPFVPFCGHLSYSRPYKLSRGSSIDSPRRRA